MSGLLNTIQSVLETLGNALYNVLDRIAPSDKRAEMFSKLQDFAGKNPKLAAFLVTHVVLTGIPTLLFIIFSISVFLFSLVTALLVGLLAAVLFTLFMVGLALLVLLPTIFMTTFTASFLFLWALGGYAILKWFNQSDAVAPEGTSTGDRISNLTGGRVNWLVDGAGKQQDDAHADVDKTSHAPRNEPGSTNGITHEHVNERTSVAGLSKGTTTGQTNGVKKEPEQDTVGAEKEGSMTNYATNGTTILTLGGATGT
ncbi:hypothetical protein N0V90_001956 [Kalmusia sp. IMI 367209]|nr:hypothetical protein N0V90_001956 [Kalmusia sp. IMI 367209]